jgi:hypothetical protein
MTDFTPERLKRWAMPSDYFGTVWPAYYSSGVGRSRDSADLEESNFAAMLKALGGESETVDVVRESHWAVGWVEWIAIHQDDEKTLRIADDLMSQLEDYPVLDETDYLEREYETAQHTWRNCYSLKDRMCLCRDAGVSIFAARREHIPEEDPGLIYAMCRG